VVAGIFDDKPSEPAASGGPAGARAAPSATASPGHGGERRAAPDGPPGPPAAQPAPDDRQVRRIGLADRAQPGGEFLTQILVTHH
jgi:hypothetical protein